MNRDTSGPRGALTRWGARRATQLSRSWRQFRWRHGGREAAARAAGTTDVRPHRKAGHVLQVEDLLLAAWILLLEEGVRRWIGDPLGLLTLGSGDVPTDVLVTPGQDGWLAWLAAAPPGLLVLVGLWLFVLLTRGPEDTDRDVALERRWPMLGLALPALSVYSLIASGLQSMLGRLPPVAEGAEPPWPGPFTPRWLRRTAALPLALVGDAVFRGLMTSITEADRFASAGDLLTPRLFFAILGTVFPYTLLVAGPRIVAGAEMAWSPWIARFVFLHAASFTHFWSRW